MWRNIDGYENLYQISDTGIVKNKRTKKILKNNLGTSGYYQVHLSKNNKSKTFLIHRLVAIAFIPNNNNFPEVNHIDENKLNNSLDNLEWVTAKMNCNHGTRLKRCNGIRKNNTKNTKRVKATSLDNKKILHFPSANEAGRNGFDKATVINCCNGKHGAKTHKGFRWEYV